MASRWIQRAKHIIWALRQWITYRAHRHPRQRALAAIGRFRSGATDVAEKHDAYLVAAILGEATGRDEPRTPVRGLGRRNPERILSEDGDT